MVGSESARRYSRPERNVGYVIAIALLAGIWALLNKSPGWQFVPFLSAEFDLVLPTVNVALAAGAAANVALIGYDPRWFKAALGLVMAGLGIAVSLRFMQVFPFSFASLYYDLTTPALVVVLVGLVTSAVMALVNLIGLGNAALRGTSAA